MTEELNDSSNNNDGNPSESAPEIGAETSQPKVEQRISKLTSQLYHKDDLIRAKDDEIKRLRENAATASSNTAVEVPNAPDRDLLDDNPAEYYKQLDARTRALAKKEWQQMRSLERDNEAQRQAEEQATQSQIRRSEIVNQYIDNGLSSGISEAKMQANEAVMRNAKINADLAEHIYSDENGAKIVDFLVDHPDKLQQISGMNPLQASIAIANEIKPQALSTKPITTNAPDPVEPTRGTGTPPLDNWEARHPNAVID